MVQLRVLQLGSVNMLPFRSEIIDSTSHSSKVESKRPLSSISDIVRDNKYRGQKNRTLKMSSYLYDTQQQFSDHFYQYVKSNIGATIPIIAFIVENNMYNANSSCCNCGGSKSSCYVNYVSALATITKIPNLKQSEYFNAPEVTITLELTTHWTGLDYMNWRRINTTQVNTQHPIDATLQFEYKLPTCDQLFNNCPDCKFVIYPQQYNSYEFMFDPVFMSKSINSFTGSCFNDCGSGKHGHVNTYSSPTQTSSMDVKSSYFGIPPKPLIVYDGITGTDDIVFRATSSKSGLTYKSYESRILIEETNNLLIANGFTALDGNDEIVVGEFVYNENGVLLRNGLIIKNGIIVTTVQPVISSDGGFYGYTEPAEDLQYFSYGSFSHVHNKFLFRRA